MDSPLASKIFATLFAIVASYMGYEKVEDYRAAQNAGNVTVTVDAGSDAHSHAQETKSLIREAIERQHEKDRALFKIRESWE